VLSIAWTRAPCEPSSHINQVFPPVVGANHTYPWRRRDYQTWIRPVSQDLREWTAYSEKMTSDLVGANHAYLPPGQVPGGGGRTTQTYYGLCPGSHQALCRSDD
jgi:hypothetical protein